MITVAFRIIKGINLAELEANVNQLLKEGWELHGHTQYVQSLKGAEIFIQPMVQRVKG